GRRDQRSAGPEDQQQRRLQQGSRWTEERPDDPRLRDQQRRPQRPVPVGLPLPENSLTVMCWVLGAGVLAPSTKHSALSTTQSADTIRAVTDEIFMRRALDLAERGRYGVSPNPMVGCVIVRDGTIIGEGWHHRAGEPHAEIEALRTCDARGATMYVTLEPCCHHGRTPPCTNAIRDAGIARVVVAMRDPN